MYRIDPNWINPKLLEPRTTPHNAGCRGLQTKDKPKSPRDWTRTGQIGPVRVWMDARS